MVVNKKQPKTAAPAAPSRTNSTTSSPKAAKKASIRGASTLKDGQVAPPPGPGTPSGEDGKPVEAPRPHAPEQRRADSSGPFSDNVTFLPSPQKKNEKNDKRLAKDKSSKKIVKKGKAKEKRKNGRGLGDSIDSLIRLVILLFTIYSLVVCPKDTGLESPVCRGLSQYRERILDPYILPPLRAAVNHPAVAPHIEKARPHVDRAVNAATQQFNILYDKAEVASRPYVAQAQLEYKLRLLPHVRVMEYNLRRYRKQAQPYINRAQPYLNRAQAAVLQTWIEAQPYIHPIVEKIEEAPSLANLYVVKPIEEARRKWVDPQLKKIVEKVEEMNASVGEKTSTPIADTVTPTTLYSTPLPDEVETPTPEPVHPTDEPAIPQAALEPEDAVLQDAPPATETDKPVEEMTDKEIWEAIPEFKDFLINMGLIDEDGNDLKAEAKEPASTSETPPSPKELTPEEKAEQERIRKDETAQKRADITRRHTQWEADLKQLAETTKQEFIDWLAERRQNALKEIEDPTGAIRSAVSGLEAEKVKSLAGLDAYFPALLKEKEGGAVKVAKWDNVVNKAKTKFENKVEATHSMIGTWVAEWAQSETDELTGLQSKLESLASRGQSDIGMDYSWLYDVGRDDWERYHELVNEARRQGDIYRAIWNGTHIEAPANHVNTALNHVKADLDGIVADFNAGLQVARDHATFKFSGGRLGTPKPSPINSGSAEPEVSILPIDIPVQDEPPVEAGGVPVDQIIIGRGAEEVEEAILRAEQAPAHEEL